jgi:uncharacterized protein YegP (UPF0339 family)
MINLLDSVTLRRDRPDLGVSAGQPGTVVQVHGDDAYEVEFVDPAGRTVALAALAANELRPTSPAVGRASLRFEIFRRRDGAFTWRLSSERQQVLANGETYATKEECRQAIRLVVDQLREAEVLDRTAA